MYSVTNVNCSLCDCHSLTFNICFRKKYDQLLNNVVEQNEMKLQV